MRVRQFRRGEMVLLAAAIVVSIAAVAVSGDPNESHVQRYFANGQAIFPSAMQQAQAAAISAMGGQPTASDRSLLLHKTIAKGIVLKKIKKKKKKNPFKKSPLKALPFLPLLGIGGAAAAATAAAGAAGTAAAGTAAKGPGAALIPGSIATTLPANFDLPIWKVHKYNGIDIRPVRWSDIPLPPPSEADFPQVVGNIPKEVTVPEPVIDVFPTPADTITFPETPAQTYGPPAQTYGPPAQTYGPPAQTYGPPAPTYGVPYPAQAPTFASPPGGEVITSTIEDGATEEGLEALSNLGALTDFLPGGGDSGGGLFGKQNRGIAPLSFFNRFIRGPESAGQAVELPAATTIFTPAQSPIQNLLGRIPIISSLTNFGSNPSTHLSIPPLPELPALPDIQNVRAPSVAAIPQIPHIRLPTKYSIRGTPYITIRVPPQPAPVIETVPVEPVPVEPVVETVRPEPSYPLPLETPQPPPQYVINSYGQPIQPVQTGYYVTPVITSPATQYGVPIFKPASVYGLPGGDSIVAASDLDPATSTECAQGKSCSQSALKVAVPEGVTRMVAHTNNGEALNPVFKKEAVAAPVDNMARYMDPKNASSTKTEKVSSVADDIDAQPSTATEEDEA